MSHPLEDTPAPDPGPRRPRLVEQVALTLRAHRRSLGQSQRAYAEGRQVSKTMIGRAERDVSSLTLGTVVHLLAATGHALAVVDDAGELVRRWDPVDLEARTRLGRRFPAHREVRPTRHGPVWWQYHEEYGNRGDGPRPQWTAQGFPRPEGTRFGRAPRPLAEGEGPRWPY